MNATDPDDFLRRMDVNGALGAPGRPGIVQLWWHPGLHVVVGPQVGVGRRVAREHLGRDEPRNALIPGSLGISGQVDVDLGRGDGCVPHHGTGRRDIVVDRDRRRPVAVPEGVGTQDRGQARRLTQPVHEPLETADR